MKEYLGKLTEMVEHQLSIDERTRNSDFYLCLKIYQSLGIDTKRSWEDLAGNSEIPTIESVGRLRRKAQKNNPALKANEVVADHRTRLEGEYREWARE